LQTGAEDNKLPAIAAPPPVPWPVVLPVCPKDCPVVPPVCPNMVVARARSWVVTCVDRIGCAGCKDKSLECFGSKRVACQEVSSFGMPVCLIYSLSESCSIGSEFSSKSSSLRTAPCSLLSPPQIMNWSFSSSSRS